MTRPTFTRAANDMPRHSQLEWAAQAARRIAKGSGLEIASMTTDQVLATAEMLEISLPLIQPHRAAAMVKLVPNASRVDRW